MKLCSTQAFTRFSYSRRFSLYNWAAIEFAGEFGLGSLSSDCIWTCQEKQIQQYEYEYVTAWLLIALTQISEI